MQARLKKILPDQYHSYVADLKEKLPKPFLPRFMSLYYSKLTEAERQKVKHNILNFVRGRSYKSGIQHDLFTKFHNFLKRTEVSKKVTSK